MLEISNNKPQRALIDKWTMSSDIKIKIPVRLH